MIYNICWFPCSKYSLPGRFQATTATSLSAKLRGDTHNQVFPLPHARFSTSQDFSRIQRRSSWKRTKQYLQQHHRNVLYWHPHGTGTVGVTEGTWTEPSRCLLPPLGADTQCPGTCSLCSREVGTCSSSRNSEFQGEGALMEPC